MDYQFGTSLIVTLGIGGINAYQTNLTRQQLKLQIEAMNKKSKTQSVPKLSYPYSSTIVMVALVAVSWVPYFIGKTEAKPVVPSASQKPSLPITTDNVEMNIRTWLDDFNFKVQKLPEEPQSYFSFLVTLNNGTSMVIGRPNSPW